jgi:predicted acetyltransferase
MEMHPVTADDRQRLAALLELYTYDFSEMVGIDVGEDGRFHPPLLLDPYFAGDPRARGFLIRVEGKLAGFALVNQGSRLSDDPTVFDMAEFLVLRKYRRQGVGERAAGWLFDHFAGMWEVRQKLANTQATAFWRRIIGRRGAFEDLDVDDERWQGPVQRFDSRTGAGRVD